MCWYRPMPILKNKLSVFDNKSTNLGSWSNLEHYNKRVLGDEWAHIESALPAPPGWSGFFKYLKHVRNLPGVHIGGIENRV